MQLYLNIYAFKLDNLAFPISILLDSSLVIGMASFKFSYLKPKTTVFCLKYEGYYYKEDLVLVNSSLHISDLNQWTNPCAEKIPQTITLPPTCFTVEVRYLHVHNFLILKDFFTK